MRSEDDPRTRAARYKDGLDAETLAALAGRDLSFGVGNDDPHARSSSDRSERHGRRAPDAVPAEANPSEEEQELSRPGGEARRLAATVEAAARTAIDRAISEGAFDNLAYAGKPLPEVVASTDPDWWTKSLLRREEVPASQGLGPEALLLRVADASMETDLDELHTEVEVRDAVNAFNARVLEARRQLLGGPPVITRTRDADAEAKAWRARRAARAEAETRRRAQEEPEAAPARRWWRRKRS